MIILVAIIFFVFSPAAHAQSTVVQSGTVTPGHAVRWISNGVAGDAGTAASGSLTSLGVTNGSGPGFCVNSGPITAAYNAFCLSASTTGGGVLSLDNYGGATGGFSIKLNGVAQGLTTAILPTVANDLACFADTTGTIKECSSGAPWQTPLNSIPIGQGTGSAFGALGPGTVRGRPLVSGDATHAPAIATGPDYYASNMGVACDGATNDVASINAAIVTINSASGGVLNLPAGTCIVGGSTIRIKNNVRLRGAGRNETTLKLLATHTGSVVQLGESVGSATAGNIALSDLTVDGNGYCPYSTCSIVYAGTDDSGAQQNVAIQRVGAINWDFLAFSALGVTDLWIEDNYCKRNSSSAALNECLNFTSVPAPGSETTRVRILRNTFINSGINGDMSNSLIEGNYVSGIGFGCAWGDQGDVYSYNNTVVNNIFTGGTGLDSNSLPPCGIESWGINNVISGNITSNNSGVGISYAGNGTVVTNNIAINNGQGGYAGWRSGIEARWGGDISRFSAKSLVEGNISGNTGAGTTQLYGLEVQGGGVVGITLGVNDFTGNATSPTNNAAGTVTARFYSPVTQSGPTSGTITFQTQAAAGTYNWNWPTTAGSSGDLATSGGGGSTAMSWTTPGALTKTDDTNVTVTLGGTPATALVHAASIQLGWTGTLAVSRGGTGGGSASGTLLDNITGFSGTGFLTRTGAGTYAFQSATNGITLGNLAQIGANTMLGNWSGSTGNVAAQAMPTCTANTCALNYTPGTGIGTNTSINAATLGGATFASPGAIGGTSASTGAFTSVTLTSSLTLNNNQYIYAKDTSNNLVPIFLLYSDNNLYIGNDRGNSVLRAGTGGSPATYIVLDSSTSTIQFAKTLLTNENLNFNVAAKTVVFKQGSNGATGTFTCVSASNVTVNNTSIAAGDTILMSWSSGTGSTTPPTVNQLTASTSFRVACASGDTAVYSYKIFRDAAWLLNRDLDPANDNGPVGLGKVA